MLKIVQLHVLFSHESSKLEFLKNSHADLFHKTGNAVKLSKQTSEKHKSLMMAFTFHILTEKQQTDASQQFCQNQM